MDAVVETSAGRVRGRSRGGGLAFRGIPYARAARWRPPDAPEPWAGVRDAAAPGPPAPQRGWLPPWVAGWFGGASGGDEQCLSLDVFTPACDGARRPVMVWIHGGAFTIGSGGAPIYDGSSLARRDVVVVTINYRLGALGFLQLGGLLPEGPFASNCGLRDQVAALRWVREHADAFGGDPGNVTIFGESAGGMSVATLLGTPAARGLFHRAIAQSGAAHNCSGPEAAARSAETLLAELGLGTARAEELLRLPVDALLDAQLRTSARLALRHGGLPWQPALDGDLLPEPPLAALERGAGAEVPLLVGTNRDEWNLFLLFDRKARDMDEDALRRRLVRAVGEADADEAHAVYRSAHDGRSPRRRWGAFQTDRIFRAPAERLAELHAAAGRDTWAYYFTWAPWLGRRRVGACHAIEIPLVFGTWRRSPLRPAFAGAVALGRTLERAWTGFARDGRPGDAAGPWPAYTPEGRTLRVLGPADERARAAFEPVRPFWAARGHGPAPA